MGDFAGKIDLERLVEESPDEFVVSAPLVYRADDDTLFSIKEGWVSDGGSVPSILWPILGPPIRSAALPAYILHDVLYKSRVVDRAEADQLLREGAIACNVSRFKAWLIWSGVRIGGYKSWCQYEKFYQDNQQFVSVTRPS